MTGKELTMQPPILVPLDGSDLAEQALPYAQAIAGSACQLILLEVGQDDDDEFRLLEQHSDSCARLETAVGNPAEQILQMTQELGVGLIVMTTHGRGAIGRSAFGSVAGEVTRRSPVPVFVVRPHDERDEGPAPTIRRGVIPLDGSPLADEALPTAASLAKQLDLSIHLVIVIGATGLVPIKLDAAAAFDATLFEKRVAQLLDDALFERSVAQLLDDAQDLLAQRAELLQDKGIITSWEVLHGTPFLAIAGAVLPGDVIVMASHGRHGVERKLLGSVAEKLLREGSVPVLLVPARERRDETPLLQADVQLDSLVLR
jgi:nucleotide-binding universal stress UspA family protein